MSVRPIEGVDYFEYDEPRVTDAWSLIGGRKEARRVGGLFRLRGGRAFYREATLYIGVRDRVRFYRVEDNGAITRRLVEPEQEIEVFVINGDTAEALGWGAAYREGVGS